MKAANEALKVTKGFIDLPRSEYFAGGIFLVSMIFAAFHFFISDGPFTPERVVASVFISLMLFAFPSLLSSVVLKLFLREVPFRRIIATSFVGEIILLLAYGLYLALNTAGIPFEFVIFIGGGVVYALWLLVGKMVFGMKTRAFLFATVHILFHFLFLMEVNILGMDPAAIALKFLLACAVFTGAIYLFFNIINAPGKRSFGLKTVDAVQMFLAQWFREDFSIEESMERIAKTVIIPMQIICLEGQGLAVKLVNPMIHYGPFKMLGSSAFPYLLYSKDKEAVALHSTVTHDMNMVSHEEAERYAKYIIERSKGEGIYSSACTYKKGNFGNASAEIIDFGKFAMVMITRAPYVTEDLTIGAGLALKKEAEKFVGKAFLVDQHNSDTEEITMFDAATPEFHEYEMAIRDGLMEKGKERNLKVGFIRKSVDWKGVGGGGVSVIVLSTEPRTALVVIDSNGVDYNLTREIKRLAGRMNVIVMSTDTHEMNAVKGVFNPLKGSKGHAGFIVGMIKEAEKRMVPAKAKYIEERVEQKVFGFSSAIEIISTANAIMAVAKILLPLIIALALVAIIFLISIV